VVLCASQSSVPIGTYNQHTGDSSMTTNGCLGRDGPVRRMLGGARANIILGAGTDHFREMPLFLFVATGLWFLSVCFLAIGRNWAEQNHRLWAD